MSDPRDSNQLRRRSFLGGLLAAATGITLGRRPARALPAAAEKPAGRARPDKPRWIGHF